MSSLLPTRSGCILTPCAPKQQGTGGRLVWKPAWEVAYGASVTHLKNSACITKIIQRCSLVLQRASLPLRSEVTEMISVHNSSLEY